VKKYTGKIKKYAGAKVYVVVKVDSNPIGACIVKGLVKTSDKLSVWGRRYPSHIFGSKGYIFDVHYGDTPKDQTRNYYMALCEYKTGTLFVPQAFLTEQAALGFVEKLKEERIEELRLEQAKLQKKINILKKAKL